MLSPWPTRQKLSCKLSRLGGFSKPSNISRIASGEKSAEDVEPPPLMLQVLELFQWMRATSSLGVDIQLNRDAVRRPRCCAALTAGSLEEEKIYHGMTWVCRGCLS